MFVLTFVGKGKKYQLQEDFIKEQGERQREQEETIEEQKETMQELQSRVDSLAMSVGR